MLYQNSIHKRGLVSAICMEIGDEWETGTIYLDVKEL